MGRYAKDTTVPVGRSRDEVEATLKRYGATEFVYGWNGEEAAIGFRYQGRSVKLMVTIPPLEDFRFTDSGTNRSDGATEKARDQAHKQRWRALVLVIKAKLEAVESGIATFEDEFLAYTLLPDGSRVGDWAEHQLAPALQEGRMPTLLLPAPRKRPNRRPK